MKFHAIGDSSPIPTTLLKQEGLQLLSWLSNRSSEKSDTVTQRTNNISCHSWVSPKTYPRISPGCYSWSSNIINSRIKMSTSWKNSSKIITTRGLPGSQLCSSRHKGPLGAHFQLLVLRAAGQFTNGHGAWRSRVESNVYIYMYKYDCICM